MFCWVTGTLPYSRLTNTSNSDSNETTVQGDLVHGDKVGGNKIIDSPIITGDIVGSIGVAIGHGASATVTIQRMLLEHFASLTDEDIKRIVANTLLAQMLPWVRPNKSA